MRVLDDGIDQGLARRAGDRAVVGRDERLGDVEAVAAFADAPLTIGDWTIFNLEAFTFAFAVRAT